MKNPTRNLLLAAAALWLTATPLLAQSFADIQGNWTLDKKSSRWGEVTQQLQLKDNKFTYRVRNKSGDTLLVARGNAKVEKLGPFKVLRLTDIEGGYTEGSYEPVNDDRALVYTTGWNSLSLALNFDQYRDGEEPEADTYKKAKD